MSSEEAIETAIREAAAAKGLELSSPANAFVLAKKTPQGWLLNGYPDLENAFGKAGFLAQAGNTDVYVLNSINGGAVGFRRDGQPDWQPKS